MRTAHCADRNSLTGHKILLLEVGGGGPYAVRPNASWVMVKWGPTVDSQIHICEKITFPQLRWRMVIIVFFLECMIMKLLKHFLHQNLTVHFLY